MRNSILLFLAGCSIGAAIYWWEHQSPPPPQKSLRNADEQLDKIEARSEPASPYEYNDSTDRHMKDLPGLRGFSDYEKEEIIEAAKKLEALERMHGR